MQSRLARFHWWSWTSNRQMSHSIEVLDEWCNASDICYIRSLWIIWIDPNYTITLFSRLLLFSLKLDISLTIFWSTFRHPANQVPTGGVQPRTMKNCNEIPRSGVVSPRWQVWHVCVALIQHVLSCFFLPMWSLVDSMFVRKTYWISHIITITAQVYLMEHKFASKGHLWSLRSTICQSRASCVHCKHISKCIYICVV